MVRWLHRTAHMDAVWRDVRIGGLILASYGRGSRDGCVRLCEGLQRSLATEELRDCSNRVCALARCGIGLIVWSELALKAGLQMLAPSAEMQKAKRMCKDQSVRV